MTNLRLLIATALFSQAPIIAQCWDQVYATDGYTAGKKTDGTYWAWGRNEGAVYADGSNTDSFVPIPLGVQDIQMLACGVFHMAAIKPDGTLWGWGSNLYGQLGQPDSGADLLQPVQMGTDSDWVSVYAGWCATFAIKSDGSLWACGFNYQGQLGIGSPDFICYHLTRVGTDNDWAYVNGGYFNTFAIRSNGTLWGMGSNDYGQIGDGTLTSRNVPVQVGTDTNWAKVCTGTSHTAALKNDGTLWSWGGSYGGLGIPGGDLNVPTQVPGIWADVSTSNLFTLALKPDNTLWGWGYNGENSLGSNLPDQPSPIQISPDTDWVSVSAGGDHSAAIKADHSLWTCGLNTHGQLGDGTNTGVNTSIQSNYPFEPVSCGALSVIQNQIAPMVVIFPNPVRSTLKIQSNTPVRSARVFDLAGREVFSDQSANHSLDLEALNPGIYILDISLEKSSTQLKFLKE